jgi:hypothetical protein
MAVLSLFIFSKFSVYFCLFHWLVVLFVDLLIRLFVVRLCVEVFNCYKEFI